MCKNKVYFVYLDIEQIFRICFKINILSLFQTFKMNIIYINSNDKREDKIYTFLNTEKMIKLINILLGIYEVNVTNLKNVKLE